MEYYSAIKKNEILSVVTTCIDLEGTVLSEISQTEKDKYFKKKKKKKKGTKYLPVAK